MSKDALRSIDADGTFQHPVREGIDQLLKMFQGKSEGNSRSIDKKMLLSYGRIFLVTFSKPVQRKSAEDNPVATPECTAVCIDACQRASTS